MIVKMWGHVAKCTVMLDGLKKVLTVALIDDEFFVKSSNKVNKSEFYIPVENQNLTKSFKDLKPSFEELSPTQVPVRVITGIEQGAYPHRMYCFLNEQSMLLGSEEFCAELIKQYSLPVRQDSAVDNVTSAMSDEDVPTDFVEIVRKCENNTLLTKSLLIDIASTIASKDRFLAKNVLDFALRVRETHTPRHLRMIFMALEVMNTGSMRKKIQWVWDVVVNYTKYKTEKKTVDDFISNGTVIKVEMI